MASNMASGKRELILVLFVRLFGLCLFRFVGFLFLLGSRLGSPRLGKRELILVFSYVCSLRFPLPLGVSLGVSSLGEERANLSAFRTFVRFVLV